MDSKCINSIRVLAADTVQKANSGHPGAPMGCAPMAHVLWTQVMNYNPENPHWAGRDRFVLSNGHACALQYCMLHLTGYKVSMDDLKQFRQVGSITPGHPERGVTDGVEVSTGPLGQGICNGVGLALAEAQLSAHYNKEGHNIIDNYTYVICGDGCLQEGVSGEASSLAGHLGLGKLIVLYDDNQITIDGETNLSFSEDVLKRYEAYGWHTSTVGDGDVNTAALKAAIEEAKSVTDRPSIIKVRTTIGLGSAKEGTEGVHGAPLGAEDLANVKTKFGLDPSKSFEVEGDVLEVFRSAGAAGAAKEAEWNAKFEKYAAEFPKEAAELSRRLRGELPEGWKDALPTYPADYKADASRNTSGQVLNAVAEVLPELIGGSADLTPSNKTALKCTGDFQRGAYDNRYLRFGVREHAMCSISNGIHAYGAHLPFAATFLVFTGYAMGAVRLSALSHHQILYIMTHDGIGVGEDGPTHQQIEILSSLRSTPNISVWRPADGNEVAAAYEYAIERRNGPTFLALSRQNINAVPGSSRDNALRGAYVVTDEATDKPAVQIVATGSEMDIAMDAMRALKEEGVHARVISMPCFELFEEQSNEYKASVFLADVPTVSVEAASVFGWAKYSHVQVGMRSFGESGPYKKVYEKFNITAEHTATVAKRAIAFYASRPVPNLLDTPDFA